MDKNHKWYHIAKQWLEGAEIEYRRRLGPYTTWSDWSLAEYPHWHDSPNDEYRVKPKDLVGKTRIVFTPAGGIITTHLGYSNVKCTFDGETNQLKSVELIKE